MKTATHFNDLAAVSALRAFHILNCYNCNQLILWLVVVIVRLRKLVKELVDLCGEENSAKLVHQVAEQAIRISSKCLATHLHGYTIAFIILLTTLSMLMYIDVLPASNDKMHAKGI